MAKEIKSTDSLNAALSFVIERNRFSDYAEAAQKFGIGKAYLSRLLSGEKNNPSDEVLKRMGIKREVVVTYTAKA
jgi:transcriptional regulator with XRE-family HTH domain